MFPYYTLIIFPILLSNVNVNKKNKIIQFSRKSLENSVSLPVFFFLLIFLLSVRDESIGRDLSTYKYYFTLYNNLNYSELTQNLFNIDGRFLFKVLNKICGSIFYNYNFYLAVVGSITVLPIAFLYCEDRTYSIVKIVLFLNMSTFILLFSGIRQSLAIAVGILAYKEVRKKRFWRFLIWCVIALAIHHSAFMLLPMYFLYHTTLKKKHIFFVVPAMLLVFVFNRQIFGILSSVLSDFSSKYSGEITQTNAYGSLILFLLFAAAGYILVDEEKADKETIGLRNFLLFSVVIQCFAPLNHIAMRLNYYYIIFLPVAFGKIMKDSKEQYKQVVVFMEIVIVVFFGFLYIRSVYSGSKTGISALDTYPYVPFWR